MGGMGGRRERGTESVRREGWEGRREGWDDGEEEFVWGGEGGREKQEREEWRDERRERERDCGKGKVGGRER